MSAAHEMETVESPVSVVVRKALSALPIEIPEITGEEVLVSRARDLAIALKCTDEVALTYLTLDIDTQFQRARAELTVFARGAREQLERDNDRKRAAERFTHQLRTASSETGFRLPHCGLVMCPGCTRKAYAETVRSILQRGDVPEPVYGDWVCDIGCGAESQFGTWEENERRLAGRNG